MRIRTLSSLGFLLTATMGLAGSVAAHSSSVVMSDGADRAEVHVSLGSRATTEVDIIDRVFAPPSLTLTAGTTVEWTNLDDEGHTVSASDGSFDSGLLGGGAGFSSTFETPGTYDYVCAVHPGMHASITVTPAVANGAPVVANGAPVVATDAPVVATDAPAEPMASPAPAASAEPAASTPSTGEASVTIVSTAYVPAALSVIAGTTVRWANENPIVHTVNARDGSFGSGVMLAGAEYSHRFEAAGIYDYFCALHPGQVGTVVVGEPGD